jgi:small-conductance mechanosensitive channel
MKNSTTDEERPVKRTLEERRAQRDAEMLAHLKERKKKVEQQMKACKDDPKQLVKWNRRLEHINRHIKMFEERIK